MRNKINAKTEFLSVINDKPKVKCALLIYGYWEEPKHYPLKVGYTKEDLNEFLSSISFNYDNGYGSQNLFGNIWLEDGTWLERSEYDGAESWEYKNCPEIPPELLNGKIIPKIEKI